MSWQDEVDDDNIESPITHKSPAPEKEVEEEDDDEEEEADYEVEKILDMKKFGKKQKFLIKWKGWELEDDQTWETEENLEGSKDLLDAFLAGLEDKGKEEKPAPKSRKGCKSSTNMKDEVKDSEPELVNLDDSDTEQPKKTITKNKAVKKDKVKTPRQTKKKEKPASSDEEDDKSNDEYKVEKILEKRTRSGKVQYKVKWKGWEDEEDLTWEPLKNLSSSKQLIEEFESQSQEKKDDKQSLFLCEDDQRIFVSEAALQKHKKNQEKTTRASKKSYEDDIGGKRGGKRSRSSGVDDEDEPQGKRKPSEAKYKPGPKSKKKSRSPSDEDEDENLGRLTPSEAKETPSIGLALNLRRRATALAVKRTPREGASTRSAGSPGLGWVTCGMGITGTKKELVKIHVIRKILERSCIFTCHEL